MIKIWPRFLSVLLCILLLAAGCGSSAAETPPEKPKEVLEEEEEEVFRTPVFGARTLNDGRKTGGSAKAKIGEELTNIFFSFCVNQAGLATEYEDSKPERGFVYLIAELTVTSAFDGPLPMWADDFLIQWGDGENDYAYPLAKFTDSQMEGEYSLKVDESVTKDLIFEVPLPEGEHEYNISYLEYYEDDVEGNMFYVIFSLSMD